MSAAAGWFLIGWGFGVICLIVFERARGIRW